MMVLITGALLFGAHMMPARDDSQDWVDDDGRTHYFGESDFDFRRRVYDEGGSL
jgi:hypothetical protein